MKETPEVVLMNEQAENRPQAEAPSVELMTADEFLWMTDNKHYEILDGVPVEKGCGAYASTIAVQLGTLLSVPVNRQKLGRLYAGGLGYRCFPNRPNHVRKPSFSFVAEHRHLNGQIPKFDFLIPPDLAVEVVTPDATYQFIETKIRDFRSVGVPLVWVVSPSAKTVQVRRPDGTGLILQESDTLTGEDVVPGFAVPVASLFV